MHNQVYFPLGYLFCNTIELLLHHVFSEIFCLTSTILTSIFPEQEEESMSKKAPSTPGTSGKWVGGGLG